MLKASRITPFLWFDGNAVEAARFYTSVFKNSKLGKVSRYPQGSPEGLEGKEMTVEFELEGQAFIGLNAGWLKDRYGLSWQVTPTILMEAVSSPDREKAERVMKNMLKMEKIDIRKLEVVARDVENAPARTTEG